MDNPTDPRTLDNLFALIDSGTEANLEMALQLSVNLPDEWKWVHKYLKSRKRLPRQYFSWYAMFAECVKYNHDTVMVWNILDAQNQVPFRIPKDTEYSMTEVMQGVALELHWQLFRVNARSPEQDLHHLEYELRKNPYRHATTGFDQAVNKALGLLSKIIKLLPH